MHEPHGARDHCINAIRRDAAQCKMYREGSTPSCGQAGLLGMLSCKDEEVMVHTEEVYGATEEKENESTEDIDTALREFLQLPRVSWNVLQREALNSSANSSKPAYSTPKGIILPVPCLPEDVNSESSNLCSLSCNSVLQQVDDSRKVEEPQSDELKKVQEPQSEE